MALLPFVDEDRLRKALSNVYPDLSDDESESRIFVSVCKVYVKFCLCVRAEERNSLGTDRLFVHNHHSLYPVLKTLYEDFNQDKQVSSRSTYRTCHVIP